MNCSQFKDPVSNICLAGTVAACWSLTQEMASSSPFTVITNIFVTEFSETFRKNSSVTLCCLTLISFSFGFDKFPLHFTFRDLQATTGASQNTLSILNVLLTVFQFDSYDSQTSVTSAALM